MWGGGKGRRPAAGRPREERTPYGHTRATAATVYLPKSPPAQGGAGRGPPGESRHDSQHRTPRERPEGPTPTVSSFLSNGMYRLSRGGGRGRGSSRERGKLGGWAPAGANDPSGLLAAGPGRDRCCRGAAGRHGQCEGCCKAAQRAAARARTRPCQPRGGAAAAGAAIAAHPRQPSSDLAASHRITTSSSRRRIGGR